MPSRASVVAWLVLILQASGLDEAGLDEDGGSRRLQALLFSAGSSDKSTGSSSSKVEPCAGVVFPSVSCCYPFISLALHLLGLDKATCDPVLVLTRVLGIEHTLLVPHLPCSPARGARV